MRALPSLLLATVLVCNLFAPRALPVVALDVVAVTLLVVAAAVLADGENV